MTIPSEPHRPATADTMTANAGPADAGQRLDKMLAARWPHLSRSRLKALIEEGRLTLAGGAAITSPRHLVKQGESYTLNIPAPEPAEPQAEAIALDIVFEDTFLLVVNKPAGMVVHPAPGNTSGTLVNALLHHCGDSLKGIGGVARPGIVHRIDKDTSGLLVVAKTQQAHTGLSALFAAHDIERRYQAVTHGIPAPPQGRVAGAIGRHPADRKKMALVARGGKAALTYFRLCESFSVGGVALASLVECRLETGRTHQVRVHMASIGVPLVGDSVYGGARKLSGRLPAEARGLISGFQRQALHAKSLGFVHPVTGQQHAFESALPADMRRLLEGLQIYRDS